MALATLARFPLFGQCNERIYRAMLHQRNVLISFNFPLEIWQIKFQFFSAEDAKTRHFARKLVFAYFYYEFSSPLKLVLKIAQPYATLHISMNP